MQTALTRQAVEQSVLIRRAGPEDWRHIRDLLAETADLYPGIDRWWLRTVLPDLQMERRVAVIVDEGSSLGGLFIGKPGRRAKVCTLRLREHLRSRGLGTLLLAEGVRNLLAQDTEELYVTVSEGAEPGTRRFFEAHGFRSEGVERDRYVRGVDEFIYSCPAAYLAAHLRDMVDLRATRTLFGLVPKRPEEDPFCRTLLVSIHLEFARLIESGQKTVEFRRRFSTDHSGASAFFYVSSPVRAVVFRASISGVDRLPTDELWSRHKDRGCLSKQVFSQYFAGMDYGYAIRLHSVISLPRPLGLDQVRSVCPTFRPPQAFTVVKKDSLLLAMVGSGPSEGGTGYGDRRSLA